MLSFGQAIWIGAVFNCKFPIKQDVFWQMG